MLFEPSLPFVAISATIFNSLHVLRNCVTWGEKAPRWGGAALSEKGNLPEYPLGVSEGNLVEDKAKRLHWTSLKGSPQAEKTPWRETRIWCCHVRCDSFHSNPVH